jgi:hypothetical protein
MFGKSWVFAVALASCLAPAPSLAQDAGVSGVPRGPGSVGGLNNSINDPSGIGNAGRIPAPPPPSMAVPVVPSIAPSVSSRVSSRPAIGRRATRQEAHPAATIATHPPVLRAGAKKSIQSLASAEAVRRLRNAFRPDHGT